MWSILLFDLIKGESNMKQYILCAAIYYNDGKEHQSQPNNIKTGYVICGRRHHNCIHTFLALGLEHPKTTAIQGFLTNDNLFVDRVEAAKIAYVAGQVQEQHKILISEDLY